MRITVGMIRDENSKNISPAVSSFSSEVAFWWDIPSQKKIPIPKKSPMPGIWRKNTQIFKNPQSQGIKIPRF